MFLVASFLVSSSHDTLARENRWIGGGGGGGGRIRVVLKSTLAEKQPKGVDCDEPAMCGQSMPGVDADVFQIINVLENRFRV